MWAEFSKPSFERYRALRERRGQGFSRYVPTRVWARRGRVCRDLGCQKLMAMKLWAK